MQSSLAPATRTAIARDTVDEAGGEEPSISGREEEVIAEDEYRSQS